MRNGVPSVFEVNQFLIVRIDYDASNNPIYYGYAKPGTLSSQAIWQLSKISYTGSNITLVQRGIDSWDNRVGTSYT